MIAPGALLIERDMPRPRCFDGEADLRPLSWMFIRSTLSPQELEKELSATGWTFFFMAGPIRTRAFGFDQEKTVYAALRRSIRDLRELGCNALQIESVERHSFLGIPYVDLTIRPRHIQKGFRFAGSPPTRGADVPGPDVDRHVVATVTK